MIGTGVSVSCCRWKLSLGTVVCLKTMGEKETSGRVCVKGRCRRRVKKGREEANKKEWQGVKTNNGLFDAPKECIVV